MPYEPPERFEAAVGVIFTICGFLMILGFVFWIISKVFGEGAVVFTGFLAFVGFYVWAMSR
tara:strand:+ start:361 stop:543 length:183 start_codon:yes stop_codon:yes gene_type:complete